MLPVWGAYIWRGLFSEFYGIPPAMQVQSNLFNTDTKGTEPSVCFTEVSILIEVGMYDLWHFKDQTNCP